MLYSSQKWDHLHIHWRDFPELSRIAGKGTRFKGPHGASRFAFLCNGGGQGIAAVFEKL